MESLKIIIADDELAIRNGLENFFKKEFPQFSVTGIYRNGLQVIEHIAREPVDIVVTDISMPIKNGIDILKYIYDKNKDIKTIMLTGYRNFEYARNAIDYGAFALLTKPINFTKLINTLSNIEDYFLSKRSTGNEAEMQRYYKFHIRHDLKMMLSGMINIKYAYDSMDNKRELYNRKCAVIDVKIPLKTYDILSQKTRDEINWVKLGEVQNSQMRSFCIENSKCAAEYIVFFYEINDCEIDNCIENFIEGITKLFGVSIFNNIIYTVRTFENIEAACIDGFKDNAIKYIDYITDNNIVAKRDYLNSISYNFNDSMCYYFVRAVLLKCKLQYSVEISAAERELSANPTKSNCIMVLKAIENEICIKKADEYDLISRIKNYMYNHCEGDFSLKSISNKFEISTAYLSRLFKQKTGENFTEFALKVKMSKAQELLNDTSLEIKQIIERLGYTGDDYFVRVFRAYYGLTPREYRRKRGISQ